MFCYDSRHDHWFYKGQLNLNNFKNKVAAIHLHDNDALSDQHLLPFDGTINWNNMMQNIKNTNYTGPITLEVIYKEEYLNMKPLDFFKKAYEIATELDELIKK